MVQNTNYQQSTNKLAGDTNPYSPKVVFQDETIITMSAASVGFSGSATIELPIDTDVAMLRPEGMVYDWDLGAGTFYNYPIAFTEVDQSTAGIRRNAEMRILIDLKPTAYNLEIILYDRAISQNNLRVAYWLLSTTFGA